MAELHHDLGRPFQIRHAIYFVALVSVPCCTGMSHAGTIQRTEAAGQRHTIVFQPNGTLLAWGDNGYAQLGDGTLTANAALTAVNNLSGVIAVSAVASLQPGFDERRNSLDVKIEWRGPAWRRHDNHRKHSEPGQPADEYRRNLGLQLLERQRPDDAWDRFITLPPSGTHNHLPGG